MTDEKPGFLKNLIDLQSYDTQIDALEKELNYFPKEINKLKIKINASLNALHHQKEQHKKILVESRELEKELKEKEELISKHQHELNSVKSNEAFKALEKEIALAKKEKDEIETRILGGLEQIEELTHIQNKLGEEFEAEKNRMEKQITDMESAKLATENKLADLKTQREKFASTMPTDISKKYEYVRAKSSGRAVSEVKKSSGGKLSCSGCNMLLNAQTELALAKKKGVIVLCDNCQRIIYLNES